MWWGCPMDLAEECGLDPCEKRPEAAVDELLFLQVFPFFIPSFAKRVNSLPSRSCTLGDSRFSFWLVKQIPSKEHFPFTH